MGLLCSFAYFTNPMGVIAIPCKVRLYLGDNYVEDFGVLHLDLSWHNDLLLILQYQLCLAEGLVRTVCWDCSCMCL